MSALHLGSSSSSKIGYFSLSTSPTRQWIDSHFLHRSAAPPTIAFYAQIVHVSVPNRWLHFVNGYPETPFLASTRVLAKSHLMVDGYRATVCTVEQGSMHFVSLAVYLPDKSLLYCVGGLADRLTSASVDREMQAVITSFHIEKVAVPTSGKR